MYICWLLIFTDLFVYLFIYFLWVLFFFNFGYTFMGFVDFSYTDNIYTRNHSILYWFFFSRNLCNYCIELLYWMVVVPLTILLSYPLTILYSLLIKCLIIILYSLLIPYLLINHSIFFTHNKSSWWYLLACFCFRFDFVEKWESSQ